MHKSEIDTHQFLAIRKAEGLKIDPRTAIVIWDYGFTLDPYGIYDLPKEWKQVGRQYFARAPNSEIWVSFYDLTNEIRGALWDRYCEEAPRYEEADPINGRSQPSTTQIISRGSPRES
jgi:hypothetical protein